MQFVFFFNALLPIIQLECVDNFLVHCTYIPKSVSLAVPLIAKHKMTYLC